MPPAIYIIVEAGEELENRRHCELQAQGQAARFNGQVVGLSTQTKHEENAPAVLEGCGTELQCEQLSRQMQAGGFEPRWLHGCLSTEANIVAYVEPSIIVQAERLASSDLMRDLEANTRS